MIRVFFAADGSADPVAAGGAVAAMMDNEMEGFKVESVPSRAWLPSYIGSGPGLRSAPFEYTFGPESSSCSRTGNGELRGGDANEGENKTSNVSPFEPSAR